MRVGMVGCGKLGLPVALSIENKGHKVVGYDIDKKVYEYVRSKNIPYKEKGALSYLEKTNIKMAVSIKELVGFSDLVFMAIQTPHDPKYEGITRLPNERKGFNYSYLIKGIKEVVREAKAQKKYITLIIISTVLPGTIKKKIKPLLNGYIHLCYNPFFIAMGTTIDDFENPEFVLLGCDDDKKITQKVKRFYSTIHKKPVYETSIINAELIKVVYNTFISTKITFINAIMEVSHKIGADVDVVSDALELATKRIISPKYMRGGMGDGGGCFPAGEIVITKKGVKPIEKVKLGNMVLSSDGTFQKVVKVWERKYDGDLIAVKVRGIPEVKMTSEHPVLTRTDGRKRIPDGRRDTYKKIRELLHPEKEIRADKLTLDYLVGWPEIKQENDSVFSNEFVELAGWYLSEGSVELSKRRGRLRFDLNRKEKKDAERIANLLESCAPARKGKRGGNARITHEKGGNRRAVRMGSMGLAKKLVQFFDKGAQNKKIPEELLWGKLDQAKILLKGIIRGDGHRSKQGVSFSTISPDLAWGVFILLHRLGIPPTLRKIPERGIHKIAYEVRVRNRRQASRLCKIIGWKKYKYNKKIETYAKIDNFVWRHIQRLERIQYKGKVFNLWVRGNHTFVVGCGAVHNCHPRDNIALSWLAKKLNLSYDYFEHLMIAREKQTEWLANLLISEKKRTNLPIVILGKAFKKESNLTVGSPTILLSNILKEKTSLFMMYDPITDSEKFVPFKAIYFIGMNHEEFRNYKFPKGSVVIDPWGITKNQKGVETIHIGRNP